MAHRHGREGRVGEQFFQPLDPGQIQVIGGLVQQQHIGLADQGFGDGQALAPSAGQRCRFGVEALEPGSAGQFAQSAFALGLIGMGRRSWRSRALRGPTAPAQSASPAARRRRRARLRTASSPESGDLAGQQRQQRRFSRAVGPDQPDAVAILNGEGDVAEQRQAPNCLVTDWALRIGGIFSRLMCSPGQRGSPANVPGSASREKEQCPVPHVRASFLGANVGYHDAPQVGVSSIAGRNPMMRFAEGCWRYLEASAERVQALAGRRRCRRGWHRSSAARCP